MLRLGLRLALHSGRDGMVRLLVTAAAVAVGVALLLAVLAELHAYEANAYQQCWSCTQGASVPSVPPARGELWNSSADFYRGQTLSRLDVAALGPGAPVPPGVARLPAPGTYDASPALAALLRTVPADELGDRFPGKLAGTIGQAALNGPNDLVIYIGYKPATLEQITGTTWVTSIYPGAARQVFSAFFKDAFYAGLLAVLLPMLMLISTATRLAADRREERFAALRLVGGTPADIRLLATVEAVLSALGGALGGTVIFLLARPLLAGSALVGTAYFSSDLTPTLAGYLGMLVIVPVAAAVAALVSLRRVQVSPLGVARRARPRPPAAWRLTVLAIGLALYTGGLWATSSQSIGSAAYPGLIITMIGLVIAGPWITALVSRLFGGAARGSSALLATRRLADNPRGAFGSVTGLVLAVFLGTMAGILVPAINETQSTPTAGTLSDILVGSADLSAPAGQQLIRGLREIGGTSVYPLYQLPAAPGSVSFKTGPAGRVVGKKGGRNEREPAAASGAASPLDFTGPVAVSCADMRAIGALGQCAPGLRAVQASDDLLFDQNPHYQAQPMVGASNAAYPGDLTRLPLQTVLVRVNSDATLERVRTYLAVHTAPQTGGGLGSAPTPPLTFGETLHIRTARGALAARIIYAAVALTLIVAGCSLAVAVGGGLVERKRPFTLLRVSGTPAGVLTRVVLLEAAVPLVVATLLAAAIAYGTSLLAFVRLAPAGTALPQLGPDYYALMGIGLAIASGIIGVTLPLLRRMTAPSGIRFE
jgi:FtsX-like permease family